MPEPHRRRFHSGKFVPARPGRSVQEMRGIPPTPDPNTHIPFNPPTRAPQSLDGSAVSLDISQGDSHDHFIAVHLKDEPHSPS